MSMLGIVCKIFVFRENSSTKLWRRISIMNPPARRSENQIDVLGTTTWGVRKVNFIYINLIVQNSYMSVNIFHFFC